MGGRPWHWAEAALANCSWRFDEYERRGSLGWKGRWAHAELGFHGLASSRTDRLSDSLVLARISIGPRSIFHLLSIFEPAFSQITMQGSRMMRISIISMKAHTTVFQLKEFLKQLRNLFVSRKPLGRRSGAWLSYWRLIINWSSSSARLYLRSYLRLPLY